MRTAVVTALILMVPAIDGFLHPSRAQNSFRPLQARQEPRISTEPTFLAASRQQNGEDVFAPVKRAMAGIFAAGLLFLQTTTTLPALAVESKIIGEIQGSGLVFKDTLNVERFEDPKVKGVTLYISNFQRPLAERLQKDFFSDPAFASVGCAKTKPTVQVADNIVTGSSGEEVFEESRSLLFKTLRVQRIYDKEKNTVVYVSFNTRLDKSSDTNKSRFKTSICAVNLD